jgi:hypothetical protein
VCREREESLSRDDPPTLALISCSVATLGSLSRRVADALSHCVEVESMKRVMQSRGFIRSQGEPVSCDRDL